jgi:hypothetical protein
MKKNPLPLLILAASLFPFAAAAQPASITWGSAQNVAGASDVDTSGTLLYAFKFGNSLTGTTTVNGVSFEPFNVPNFSTSTATVGSVTLTAVSQPGYGAVLSSGDNATSASNPFAALPASYQTLLSGVVLSLAFDNDPGQPLSIQLGGLTAGGEYLVQWWSSVTDGYVQSQTVALGSPSVTLDSNTSDVAGGLGQFATGTFTASDSFETFTLEGLQMYAPSYDLPTINALQVRVVPEPSTLAMVFAGLGFAGYSLFRRRAGSSD